RPPRARLGGEGRRSRNAGGQGVSHGSARGAAARAAVGAEDALGRGPHPGPAGPGGLRYPALLQEARRRPDPEGAHLGGGERQAAEAEKDQDRGGHGEASHHAQEERGQVTWDRKRIRTGSGSGSSSRGGRGTSPSAISPSSSRKTTSSAST